MTDPFRKPFRAVDQPWYVTALDVAVFAVLLVDVLWNQRRQAKR